jgi:DNA helicase-4
VTLNGERVKGFGELSIANFLFRNGIEYEYEAKYHAADLATKIHRQYKPDFFLPKYNIYIEHFGIDENGGTAPGIDASKYRDSMEWKRRVHQKNETRLIESYHHQLLKMVLLKKLRDNLLEQKVEFAPLSKEQLKEHLLKTGEIRRFTVLVKSFLNLYKSQNLELSDLIRASELIADLGRTKLFLKIFEKFYKRYSQHLNKNGNIDFHDMIKLAAQQVKNQEFVSPYKHIIVDEFQDISHCRATLIKELLDSKSDTRLFCVGDDWQSIYRFTGSDVSLMTRFSDHFGHAARIDLDKTFRFNDKLVSASTKFVTGNPQQLKKVISANREIVVPPIHVLAANPEEEATSPLFNALRQISERDPQASVLILARYNFMLRDLPQNLSNSFPLLQISLKTSHASKGQEADYVIGVGLVSGKHGFPSEIVDDPILDVVMPEGEGFANAEERRLFYVTITRARHEVFLLTEASSPSKFIQELESKEYREFVDSELCEKDYPICRVCGSSLVERNSINGKFWGCMNYPYCDGLGVSCPSCEIGVLVNINGHGACTDEDCSYTTLVCHGIGCNGFFLPRNGKFGPFYGCSNYPDCKCTRDRLPEGFAGSTK